MALSAFKSYDIRGRLGVDLDADLMTRIGQAFAAARQPGVVVTGRDVRPSSAELHAALIEGLRDGGADVVDIGLCGTEEVYFATDHLGAGGGLMVTASHNPIDWNGLKLVGPGARPIGRAHGLAAIEALAEADAPGVGAAEAMPGAGPGGSPGARGGLRQSDTRDAYAARVAGFADPSAFRPLHILADPGHGTAGPALDMIAGVLARQGVPLTLSRIHHAPDPSFPAGIPNPLVPDNRAATAAAVIARGADLGVAWDGDFDRCFFFDEAGDFVDGEYVVALLAAAFLRKDPGATIVHDPRVVLATTSAIAAAGGVAVAAPTGHANLKAAMRETGAVYGGEMSAHHYFRDFMACDSGMVPWILIAELMGRTGQPLSALVADMRARYPSSGEINFRVADADAAIAAIEARLVPEARAVDRLDGLSLRFAGWRMNLRRSNTEPLLRLNVEAEGDRALVEAKVAEISALIEDA